MKSSTVIWLVVGVFVLAAGVVYFVLHKTQDTLKEAKKTADSAAVLTEDITNLGSLGKKVWGDAATFFGTK